MNKIIINADDCGYSMLINCAIKETIEAGKISSTTVMANMSDFDGSIKLFDEYSKHISFGVHLNLTEGRPLTKSKVLFDAGIMTESEDGVMFTGKDIRYTKLNENLKKAIYEELNQQVHKVYDNIRVSHIDSHHHIHTGTSLIPIVTEIAKEYNIKKIRRLRNYMPLSSSRIARDLWGLLVKLYYPQIQFTRWFCSFEEYYSLSSNGNFRANGVIELMVHPGGIFVDEEYLLRSTILQGELINYNQL